MMFCWENIDASFLQKAIAASDLDDDMKQLAEKNYDDKTMLKEFYIENDNTAGMLVMPTGSGKTRTAVYFLTREMISRRYQIIWIAHRHMLIEQAAESFYNFSGLIKEAAPTMNKYSISCISGKHLQMSQAHKNDNLIVSVASVCRSKEHLRNMLGRKIMIVVDESHHTYARSYRDTISFIKKHRSNVKLLGLTATPVRSNERGSAGLMRLFDNNIIYSVSMSELISKGILSKPSPVRLETKEAFEKDFTPEEISHISKYDDLPESVLRKIGQNKARNQMIIREYLNHRKDYGKTLIFALDIEHCRLLGEEFKAANISYGVVYSGKQDNDIRYRVKMDDIELGNYVPLFRLIDNELGMYLFKRNFNLK